MNRLNAWLRRCIGESPTRERVAAFQEQRLRETLRYAASGSAFYRERLRGLDIDFMPRAALPFTYPEELARDPDAFLCVKPDEISRVVTLPTSGTTGVPKRVAFTESDLAATEDFFRFGMANLAPERARVMVFMPGAARGSVGDLLSRALSATGREAVVYGIIDDYADAARALDECAAKCVVGLPAQMLALARFGGAPAVEAVLLSADFIPRTIIAAIENAWDCRVFAHWGMTETCLGGAVECSEGYGAHIREADLLLEIVDPHTGLALPAGAIGEIIVTTLGREAMPLIRYRTGDFSRILPGECPCGCALLRLGRVFPRGGGKIAQQTLDEALYPLDFIRAFRAEKRNERLFITVELCAEAGEAAAREQIFAALSRVPALDVSCVTLLFGAALGRENGSVKRRLD
ncbi:MAG: AMP-binding protein [Oscillospiraceae bacterium]|nr:AMP-binding protein [Oscillospiraceae bacterium]